MSTLHRGLASHPGRSVAARSLLEDLWAEYERLLRCVGEETMARALRQRADGIPPVSPGSDANTPESRPSGSESDLRPWATRSRDPSGIKSSPGLSALLDRIGPPPREIAAEHRGGELERLRDGASEDAIRELRLLPNDVQRAYLRLLTARLNALRGSSAGAETATREWIGRLLGFIRDYTREHRPGAVYGLSRDHEPKGGSWEADSQYLWHRLTREDDEAPISKSAPAPSGQRIASVEDDDDEREPSSPEPDWPLWPWVRGRSVLLVGGDPTEAARAQFERGFAIRKLTWSRDDVEASSGAYAGILSGEYDLVLGLLPVLSQDAASKVVEACAAKSVRYVAVEHGVGIGSIRAGLERAFASAQAASSK